MIMVAAVLAGLAVALAWPATPGERLARLDPVGLPAWADQRLAAALLALIAVPLALPGVTGMVLAVPAAAATWWAADRVADRGRERQRRVLATELPRAVSLLASALAAGAALRNAVAEVARVSPPATRDVLDSVTAHITIGRSESEAWSSVAADPVAGPVWGRVARDLARNARSGAAVVELLRVHAAEARASARALVEKEARTVGVQAVLPLTVCFLPAFVLVGVVPIIVGLASTFRL